MANSDHAGVLSVLTPVDFELRPLLHADEIAELERTPVLEIEGYRRQFGRGTPDVPAKL
ncbi:MAG TPA: hypothetical protein VFH29_09480 [Anaerolineales bacterium]|nr:hypothetical protein [Anaerolineales bacterium]